MRLELSEADEAFRQEVRAFIHNSLPDDTRRRVEMGLALRKEDHVTWQKILFRKGWIAPHWPREYGGTGWSLQKRYIFEEELGRAPTPAIIRFGLLMVAPVLMTFGSDEQKRHYLPRILSSDDWWCQGYSEPGSGSDLASLTTRAEKDGEDYLVNGMKTWITLAQHADQIFCLVRTGESKKKQEGISFLLIDMKSPGVSVRPIPTFDGGDEINEVHFTNVRVPRKNLVGEEGKGWTYAKFLLGHERTGVSEMGRLKKWLGRVKRIAQQEASGKGTLAEDPLFQRKIASVEIDLLALESMALHVLSQQSTGRAPGAEASLLKIRGTELQQDLTELLFESVGYYANPYFKEVLASGWHDEAVGPPYAAPLAPFYFNWRKASIYAGSNEIQKNIIAKMVLGF